MTGYTASVFSRTSALILLASNTGVTRLFSVGHACSERSDAASLFLRRLEFGLDFAPSL